jgi:hypothetical protein
VQFHEGTFISSVDVVQCCTCTQVPWLSEDLCHALRAIGSASRSCMCCLNQLKVDFSACGRAVELTEDERVLGS